MRHGTAAKMRGNAARGTGSARRNVLLVCLCVLGACEDQTKAVDSTPPVPVALKDTPVRVTDGATVTRHTTSSKGTKEKLTIYIIKPRGYAPPAKDAPPRPFDAWRALSGCTPSFTDGNDVLIRGDCLGHRFSFPMGMDRKARPCKVWFEQPRMLTVTHCAVDGTRVRWISFEKRGWPNAMSLVAIAQ